MTRMSTASAAPDLSRASLAISAWASASRLPLVPTTIFTFSWSAPRLRGRRSDSRPHFSFGVGRSLDVELSETWLTLEATSRLVGLATSPARRLGEGGSDARSRSYHRFGRLLQPVLEFNYVFSNQAITAGNLLFPGFHRAFRHRLQSV